MLRRRALRDIDIWRVTLRVLPLRHCRLPLTFSPRAPPICRRHASGALRAELCCHYFAAAVAMLDMMAACFASAAMLCQPYATAAMLHDITRVAAAIVRHAERLMLPCYAAASFIRRLMSYF